MRVLTMVVLLTSISAFSKDKPKAYETGTLLDVTVQDTTDGAFTVGVITTFVPEQTYLFQIGFNNRLYLTQYHARRYYKPEWIVNDPINLRIAKDKMFLKRPDGKELETKIIRTMRPKL